MDDLIFDRTQEDIDNKTNKGYYNASDLNRVEEWCEYLETELNEAGYSISITTKTDWTMTDLRTEAEMNRIRNNIKALYDGYYLYGNAVYSSVSNFDYKKANRWEEVLNNINLIMTGMKDYYVHSGVSSSGQSRTWQNRFRRY